VKQRYFIICVECCKEYMIDSVEEADATNFCVRCGGKLTKNHILIEAAKQPKIEKWDRRFLELAKFVSQWSNDPSTKVGAVVVGPDRYGKIRRVVGLGFNGFACGINDEPARYENRDLKIKLIRHGEDNAMTFAKFNEGCTLYTWPFQPCSACAGRAIQEGICRIVAPVCPKHLLGRWGEEFKLSEMQLQEAGIPLQLVKL